MSSDTPSGPQPDGSLGPAPVTARMLELARLNAGGQVYVIDPEFDPDGDVPGWAVRGYYPVAETGVLDTAGWVSNPDYRPGPLTLGWPRPGNRVERALQLAAAGYQPDTLLLAALAQADVVIPTTAEHPEHVPVAADHEGRSTVTLFTTEGDLDGDTPRVTVPVTALLPLLPQVTVVLNPGRVPSARVSGAALTAAITQAASPTRSEPTPR